MLLQACKRPQPSTGTLACLLGTLLSSLLSLEGLFAAAAAGKPPAAASAWLHAHLASSLMQRCPNCARAIAVQYQTASPDAQLVCCYTHHNILLPLALLIGVTVSARGLERWMPLYVTSSCTV